MLLYNRKYQGGNSIFGPITTGPLDEYEQQERQAEIDTANFEAAKEIQRRQEEEFDKEYAKEKARAELRRIAAEMTPSEILRQKEAAALDTANFETKLKRADQEYSFEEDQKQQEIRQKIAFHESEIQKLRSMLPKSITRGPVRLNSTLSTDFIPRSVMSRLNIQK